MGLLADFFVATEQQALDYFESGADTPVPLRYEYTNYTDLSLSMLWAQLEQVPFDFERHQIAHVRHSTDGETWLFRFPEKLCRDIAKMDPNAIAPIAHVWAQSGEVPGDGPDNEPTLRDLKALCGEALATGRSVYLWGSL